jgi:protein-disulfide isomerase
MNRLVLPVDGRDHIRGPAAARASLVEYADYECPASGGMYPVIKRVRKRLGDELRFAFRNFPLTQMHDHSLHAAQFAEAAGAKGVFWEAHDILFEHQRTLGDDWLYGYGEEIGLDAAALKEAFGGRFDQRIREDRAGGLRSGVNGTPTLFIHGLRYDGPRDVESLVAALASPPADGGA